MIGMKPDGLEMKMELADIHGTSLKVSPVAIHEEEIGSRVVGDEEIHASVII